MLTTPSAERDGYRRANAVALGREATEAATAHRTGCGHQQAYRDSGAAEPEAVREGLCRHEPPVHRRTGNPIGGAKASDARCIIHRGLAYAYDPSSEPQPNSSPRPLAAIESLGTTDHRGGSQGSRWRSRTVTGPGRTQVPIPGRNARRR